MNNIIVLIPHYNNNEGLLQSLLSISETHLQVDILVIDDGSKNPPILKNLQQNYSCGKIIMEVLEKNRGIENALNEGLNIIKKLDYEYIGRLDCGDLCLKDRFKKQVEYLTQNKDVFLLGTWANIKDTQGKLLYVLKHPTQYDDIKNKMYINSMFVHPSVVFRTEVLKHINGYPTNYKAAEDYAFFFKLIHKYKAENMPEALLDYIIDENSISSQKRFIQVKSRIRIIIHHFKFGIYPIYGLIRNILLLFMSRNITTVIKKVFNSKE
ncbi:glycosyltransferase [Pseudotamlana agarivorans]|uniref:glycosyltransferase n=1 Tax=Pseudotamlana agarivorans TaxID=481183 RepID=UPI00082AC8E1|nr:glycosyltransferase [Tamlana agarivorans]